MKRIPPEGIDGPAIETDKNGVFCSARKQEESMWVRVEQKDCFVGLEQSRMPLPFCRRHASRFQFGLFGGLLGKLVCQRDQLELIHDSVWKFGGWSIISCWIVYFVL